MGGWVFLVWGRGFRVFPFLLGQTRLLRRRVRGLFLTLDEDWGEGAAADVEGVSEGGMALMTRRGAVGLPDKMIYYYLIFFMKYN